VRILHGRTASYLIAVALAAIAVQAQALDEIYSPNIEYREVSVEYNGSRTFDANPQKNNAQEHELTAEIGLTPRFEAEISAGFTKESDDALRMEDFEIEGRYQFFEAGENWLDSGMLVAYDFSTVGKTSDNLEVKLLLQKDVGKFTHTANIGFDQSVGNYAEGGPDYVLLWNSRYRYNINFQPGIEIQSDLGNRETLGNYNLQEHYAGPAVYGELIPHLKYQAAWLFGTNEASSSSAARLLLEYEMHF
jgi:hypothetical protein